MYAPRKKESLETLAAEMVSLEDKSRLDNSPAISYLKIFPDIDSLTDIDSLDEDIDKSDKIARLDGINFSNKNLTKSLERQDGKFNRNFMRCMVRTAYEMMKKTGASHGHVASDEISLFIPEKNITNNGKKQKLVSTYSSTCTVIFNRECTNGKDWLFDCRIFNMERVVDYFYWRCENTEINTIHGYLESKDKSSCNGTDSEQQINILKELGFDYEKSPDWYKKGVMLYWETYNVESKPGPNGKVSNSNTKRRLAMVIANYKERPNCLEEFISSGIKVTMEDLDKFVKDF